MNLSPQEVTIFFLSIGLMLLFARVFGELVRKLKQPLVIGEILAGIILGPSVFGYLFPGLFIHLFENSHVTAVAINSISTLSVVMLLLVTGIEIDLTVFFKQGKAAVVISLLGTALPFIVGFIVAYYFPNLFAISNPAWKTEYALFIGCAISITALPLVARTLMDLNLFKTDLGLMIISSAMFIDTIGWLIFSFILGLVRGEGHRFSLWQLIILLVLFTIVILVLGRKPINIALKFLERKTSYPGAIINFVFVLGFIGAAFTEWIGVHAIFGAFIVGIALGDSVFLKEQTKEIIQQFVTNIFAPLFFISIGLRINFVANFDLRLLVIFLVLVFVTKMVGLNVGARLVGLNKEDSMIVSAGLNSHGSMELILGLVALEVGLIDTHIFVALVIMALITSLSSAPIMNFYLRKSKKKLTFNELVKPEKIIFTSAEDKESIIEELCSHISMQNKLNADAIFKQVWAREQQISTGLANHLAIPHARVSVPYPLISIAVQKDGIDFESLDGLPAKVIILLLTPANEPEMQLKLLAEISRRFVNPEIVNGLVQLNSKEEIISKLKQLS